jgi:hypothetical protein
MIVAYDDAFMLHLAGIEHPEHPGRVRAVADELARRGLLGDRMRAVAAAPEQIVRVHPAAYVERVKLECERVSLDDYADLSTGDTTIDKGSYEGAMLAAGATLAALDRVVAEGRAAFAVVRPPGHHAEPARGMGFCMFNNAGIAARSYALVEQTTGRLLSGVNVDVRLPMASTTKIMTGLLACESGRLDEIFTVPAEALRVEGSSMYLVAGEKLTLRDITYGLLLESGNDAANTIAFLLDGSLPAFVERMNQKALELGLENTHFDNPSGLDGPTHYTTALDLARHVRRLRHPFRRRVRQLIDRRADHAKKQQQDDGGAQGGRDVPPLQPADYRAQQEIEQ